MSTPAPAAQPFRGRVGRVFGIAGAVLGLTALLSLLVTAFAWPASRIEPRDLPIAVAGPAGAVPQVEQALAGALDDDAFVVTGVGSRDELVAAVESREVYGGLVLGPAGTEMLTASAASPAVAQLLGQVADRLGSSTGEGTGPGAGPATVTDVVAAPPGDPRGTAFAAGSLPLVLGGIITAAVLALRIPSRSGQVVGALGVAAGAGLALGGVLQLWIGALAGSYWANAAVMALGLGAGATFLLGLRNVLGVAGLGLGAATLTLLGNPLSGVTSAPELLPDGWSDLGRLLPPGAMGQALRSTAFFDGAAAGTPLWVLGVWLAGGLALLALPGRRTAVASSGAELDDDAPRAVHAA